MEDYYATCEWPKTNSAAAGSRPSAIRRKRQSCLNEGLEFLGAFLRKPRSVGSVWPSSPTLAREVVAGCRLHNASTVVELGPGTGAITRFILDGLARDTLFFALELNQGHVHRLRHRFPQLEVYHDSAERIRHYLDRHGRQKADCIISTLPWGNMGRAAQARILGSVRSSLKSGGVFSFISYIHAGWYPTYRTFRKQLQEHFRDCRISPVVWMNVPPAVVYRCW